MLRVLVPMGEEIVKDDGEITNSFYYELDLEHSLVSLSKWESKFGKPFLEGEDKTDEEAMYYIEAMTLDSRTPREVYANLTEANVRQAFDYINEKQTATTFHQPPGQTPGVRKEIITAEIIYYWMISYKIPLDWENRHLNRLFALIQVMNLKNQPEKKMNKQESLRQRRMLNEQRRKQYGTGG